MHGLGSATLAVPSVVTASAAVQRPVFANVLNVLTVEFDG